MRTPCQEKEIGRRRHSPERTGVARIGVVCWHAAHAWMCSRRQNPMSAAISGRRACERGGTDLDEVVRRHAADALCRLPLVRTRVVVLSVVAVDRRERVVVARDGRVVTHAEEDVSDLAWVLPERVVERRKRRVTHVIHVVELVPHLPSCLRALAERAFGRGFAPICLRWRTSGSRPRARVPNPAAAGRRIGRVSAPEIACARARVLEVTKSEGALQEGFPLAFTLSPFSIQR